MGSTGQAAIEYLAMMGIALLLTAPVVIEVQQASMDLQHSYQHAQTKDTLNNIEEAATLVNAQGTPAQVTFRVQIPSNVVHTNVTGQYLHIRREIGGQPHDMYNVLEFNVSGTIPTDRGVYAMTAKAEEEYVNITTQ